MPAGRLHHEPATPAFDVEDLLTAREATDWATYHGIHNKRRVLEELLTAYESNDGSGIPVGEFTLSAQWVTTPAVNDQVVLASRC